MRWWLAPVLTLVAGCNNCNGSQSSADAGTPVPPSSSSAAADAAPAKPRKAPTGGEAALTQLSADVDARLAQPNTAAEEREKLVDLLLQRAEFMGRPSDLVRADQLTKSWPEQHFARAKVLAATMRFADATAELDRATTAPKPAAAKLRFAILMGHGEYEAAEGMLPTPIEDADASWVANAGLLALRMQKKDAGRKLIALAMQKAEDDGAPLPYAWLCHQQGLLYAQAGDDLSAESWFGSAVNIVPQYAGAAVRLAPSQNPNVALTKLTELAKTSDHPEVAAARASVLETLKRADEAKAATAEAAKGYTSLVEKLPAAFSADAARFYLGPGKDPKKAVTLAKDSAKLRPTEEAADLWISAAEAAKDTTEACAASAAMRELAFSSDRGRAHASKACP